MAHGVGDRIGLDGVADAETGEHAETGKKESEPFPFFPEAVPDIVHGAADIIAEGIAFPEAHRQNRFGKLGRHAGKGNKPHPEKRAGAAEKDSGRHTGDIAGADSCGHGGHQGVERGNVAGLIVFPPAAPHHFEGIGNAALRHETVTDRQEKAGAGQKRQQNRAADDVVELLDQSDESVHPCLTLPVPVLENCGRNFRMPVFRKSLFCKKEIIVTS